MASSELFWYWVIVSFIVVYGFLGLFWGGLKLLDWADKREYRKRKADNIIYLRNKTMNNNIDRIRKEV